MLRVSYLLGVLLLVGCGHPATEQECQEIVERVAKLEIQQSKLVSDPTLMRQQIDTTKKSLKETTLKDCVGKRITDRAMNCVRTAKTSQEIVGSCFR
jgi:hypothetical protein